MQNRFVPDDVGSVGRMHGAVEDEPVGAARGQVPRVLHDRAQAAVPLQHKVNGVGVFAAQEMGGEGGHPAGCAAGEPYREVDVVDSGVQDGMDTAIDVVRRGLEMPAQRQMAKRPPPDHLR